MDGRTQVRAALGVRVLWAGPLILLTRAGWPLVVHAVRVWMIDRGLGRAVGVMHSLRVAAGTANLPLDEAALAALVTRGLAYMNARLADHHRPRHPAHGPARHGAGAVRRAAAGVGGAGGAPVNAALSLTVDPVLAWLATRGVKSDDRARVLMGHPAPLPGVDQPDAGWDYYVSRSHPGKPDRARRAPAWRAATEAVASTRVVAARPGARTLDDPKLTHAKLVVPRWVRRWTSQVHPLGVAPQYDAATATQRYFAR
jgi:hypothetical protein